MPEFFVPPKLPIAPPLPPKPISKTVTGTAAVLLTGSVPCIGVWLQSSSKDDSNASMSGIIYVLMESTLGSGTFDVLCCELVTGQETWVPVDNVNRLKIKTQTGTGWVRGFAIPVQAN